MTTYCAVVKYEVDATDGEKVRALREGLSAVAMELAALGVPMIQIEDDLEDARSAAELEHEYAAKNSDSEV